MINFENFHEQQKNPCIWPISHENKFITDLKQNNDIF